MKKTIFDMTSTLEEFSKEYIEYYGFPQKIFAVAVTEDKWAFESHSNKHYFKFTSMVFSNTEVSELSSMRFIIKDDRQIDEAIYRWIHCEYAILAKKWIAVWGILIFTDKPEYAKEFKDRMDSMIQKIVYKREKLNEQELVLFAFQNNIWRIAGQMTTCKVEYVADLEVIVSENTPTLTYMPSSS